MVCEEFIAAKVRSGRSERYVRQLRSILGAFARGRRKVPLRDLTAAEIEGWLAAQPWSARTVRNSILDLRTVFAWAIRRRYLDRSPMLAIDPPRARSSLPALHSADEVRAVLEAARRSDPHVMRLLAIRYFAGLRSAEAGRLREQDVHVDRGFIEVTAANAKTRARRLVPIVPALRAWLELGGELGPMRTDRVRQAVRASGVVWPHNVTRHSFVSYRLASLANAGQVAMEAGTSEAMLFRHYREVTTPEAAAAFWAIRP